MGNKESNEMNAFSTSEDDEEAATDAPPCCCCGLCCEPLLRNHKIKAIQNTKRGHIRQKTVDYTIHRRKDTDKLEQSEQIGVFKFCEYNVHWER